MVDTHFQTIKLKKCTTDVLIKSKAILQDGEVCLISTKDDSIYDSLVIGNGQKEAKDLGLVPLNVQKGSTFLGMVAPTYVPGTPRSNVFYLAERAGEYKGFGNIQVNKGEVAFIQWMNGGWSKLSVNPLVVDSELSEDSDNPVQNKVVTKRLGELESLMIKNITMSGVSLEKNEDGTVNIPVDTKLSTESINPVQNKAVTQKFADLDDWYEI